MPKISNKVIEYFIEFINENVCSEKKVIVNGNWTVVLAIFFLQEGKRYTSREIFLAVGARKIKQEGTKLYEIVVPSKLISESEDCIFETINLIYRAISIFFTKTYKKVTSEFMDLLWEKVDTTYLKAIMEDK